MYGREHFGHFLQGYLGAFLATNNDYLWGLSNQYNNVLRNTLGTMLLVIYPVYNLIKRLRLNKKLKDTSYFHNLADWLAGIFVYIMLFRPKKILLGTPFVWCISITLLGVFSVSVIN